MSKKQIPFLTLEGHEPAYTALLAVPWVKSVLTGGGGGLFFTGSVGEISLQLSSIAAFFTRVVRDPDALAKVTEFHERVSAIKGPEDAPPPEEFEALIHEIARSMPCQNPNCTYCGTHSGVHN